MMVTDSNMTSRQSTHSSINDRAATLRIVNKFTDVETKTEKRSKPPWCLTHTAIELSLQAGGGGGGLDEGGV